VTTDVAEVTQATPVATQAESIQETAPDAAELDEARAALGLATQGEPSTEAAATGTELDADTQALLDANAARVREEASATARQEERRTLEEQQRLNQSRVQLDGIRRSFAQRAQAIRAFAEEQGWNKDAVNRVVETFNSHHAQVATVRDADWWDHTFDYVDSKLGDAAKTIRADYEAGKIENFHTLLDRITEAREQQATTGRYTKAQLEEEKVKAFIAGKRAAAQPGAQRTGLPQARSTGSPTSISQDQRNLADKDWVATTPLAEVTAARERIRAATQ